MPTPKSSTSSSAASANKTGDIASAVCHGYGASELDHSPPGGPVDVGPDRTTRGSVSNENNILLDPEVLTDYPTQALLLTVLVRSDNSVFDNVVYRVPVTGT